MSRVTAADLRPWLDADALIDVSGRLGHDVRPDLRDAVFVLLDHSDPDVREEALRALGVRWKDGSFRDAAVTLIATDPEDAVRAAAAYALAAITNRSNRVSNTRALLDVVFDETASAHVRGAAYEALLIIYRRPTFPPATRDMDPRRDVDWDWIRSIAAQVGRGLS